MREDLGFFIVADGMGGHAAGEVASRLVVEEVERFVAATAETAGDEAWPGPLDPALGRDGNRLRAGLAAANRCLAREVERDAALHGMATTAVALLVGAGAAAAPQIARGAAAGTLAHVGDSRAYLRRANVLRRLTRDHSWVEEQVRAGMLTAAAALRHPWRNIVTRAVSGGDDLEAEVSQVALAPGDRVLLCSDGLSSVVPEPEIDHVLDADLPLEAVCERLVERANAAGGPDNVTVVVVDVDAD